MKKSHKIKAIILCHPQSKDLLTKSAFDSTVDPIRIACGMTKPKKCKYSESNDFFPTYASLNSCLFESSVILTVWEHAQELIGDNHVAIMHTDIIPHYEASITWGNIIKALEENPNRSLSITAASYYQNIWEDWEIQDDRMFRPNRDPLFVHSYDNNINVWKIIKYYDPEAYDYAFNNNIKMIYSHQFACSRETFDYLGYKLKSVIERLSINDIGLWTPHVLERLIAIYLAQRSEPMLTTAFWHFYSSGSKGPGDLNLYGPRPFKYYRVSSRFKERH
jgi:hypothetical protein